MQEALAGAGYADGQGREEVERLRAMVVALEAECAVLAVALDEDRHEYDPDDLNPGWCRCRYRVDSRWHRTAAWVRRRHGFGAT